ncbi:citrate synthase [Thermophilibacter immobilis]|uniref:citrate synthase (unknown stereospecificity) n=1 Tax=Thermophilibacter immobilis TaxID=2779519 RepID=A0A7S7M971_9ACTN|nr:citrate synthase [Thermophilibacter immobilis]
MKKIPQGTFGPILTPSETSAFGSFEDSYPMPSVKMGVTPVAEQLYHGAQAVDVVDPELYRRYDVKRGLRNADGSGVLVGLTTISNVHGYKKTAEGVEPDEGALIYRGYSVGDLIDASQREDRFGYEEVAYLLISGALPTQEQLDDFRARIDSRRQLSERYLRIFPRTTQSHSIMNVMQRATLLLYAFDPMADGTSPVHEVDVACSLFGRWPRIAAVAAAADAAARNDERLVVPPAREGYSMAETILDVLRADEGFTHDEAMLLDVMFVLHAEHGGGNNSTFATRVLSSSGTDAYSAYAAAIGSLKGPKHGGANSKVSAMIDEVATSVSDWSSDDELAGYLEKIARKEAFDKTGLIYGLGHAVYTLSDPRAQLVKKYARKLADEKGQAERLALIEGIERLGPQVMRDVKGTTKPLCANIDLYTGFIYALLGITPELYTPIFAMARLAGWCAHRMEELYGAGRIIRPAYNSVMGNDGVYVSLAERR